MRTRPPWWCAAALAALSASCDRVQDPAPNLPPTIVSYSPTQPDPSILAGNPIVFTVHARDPENRGLDYAFTVDGEVVVRRNLLTYSPATSGKRVVRAMVSDGVNTVAHQWELTVNAAPDTIAPARVVVALFAATPDPGEAEIEWVAVGDDGFEGTPAAYRVRFDLAPIAADDAWAQAMRYADVVSQAPSGTPIHIMLVGLPAGRTVYACVRAVDDAGNLSLLSDSPGTELRGYDLTGRVTDPLTGEGVPGADVSFGARETLTDAAGRFRLLDLPGIATSLFARDELDPAIGSYSDCVLVHQVVPEDTTEMYLLPNVALVTQLYPNFRVFFRDMTDVAGIPYPAETRRWELPIDLYVREFDKDGLDYGATVRRVAGEFDAVLGRPVFHLVDAVPAVGVEIRYRNDIARDNYSVSKWTADWYPEQAVIEFRQAYGATTEAALDRVARHELGHALGLNHSLDPTHVMVGGPAPSASSFSPDEVAVMRCFYGVRRGWDNRLFLDD